MEVSSELLPTACTFELCSAATKGQLISKAIHGVLDSPKKRTKKVWLDMS